MRSLTIFITLLGIANAQSNQPTETFVIARAGVYTNSGSATYHFAEVFQVRGRWIFPDVVYIDFGGPSRYRETAVGAGAVLYNSKHLTVIEELYFNQATGPASGGAFYVLPWTLVKYRVTTRLVSQVVYFPYLPLNKAGRIQHIIESAKLEYDFKHFKAGGGYGAYKFGDGPWQNKPFVTATLKAGRFGNIELWLQKMPQGHAQVQVRYAKIFN